MLLSIIYASNMAAASETPYSAEALITSLDLEQLGELCSILHPANDLGPLRYWAQVVHQTRLDREEEIEEALDLDIRRTRLRNSPHVEGLGPHEYLTEVRQVNRSTDLDDSIFGRLALRRAANQRRLANRFAEDQLNDHYKEVGTFIPRQGNVTPFRGMVSFLGVNLHRIMVGPQVVAMHQYYGARSQLFRTYLPHFVSLDEKLRAELDETDLGTAITHALYELRQVDRLPDLFEIDRTLQRETIQVLTAEWLELCRKLHAIDPTLLATPAHRTSALAYVSLHDLHVMLGISPFEDVPPPAAICKAFLCSPCTLEEEVAKLLGEA